jgi:hypothetical protein
MRNNVYSLPSRVNRSSSFPRDEPVICSGTPRGARTTRRIELPRTRAGHKARDPWVRSDLHLPLLVQVALYSGLNFDIVPRSGSCAISCCRHGLYASLSTTSSQTKSRRSEGGCESCNSKNLTLERCSFHDALSWFVSRGCNADGSNNVSHPLFVVSSSRNCGESLHAAPPRR